MQLSGIPAYLFQYHLLFFLVLVGVGLDMCGIDENILVIYESQPVGLGKNMGKYIIEDAGIFEPAFIIFIEC
jgi:hypothetical protein